MNEALYERATELLEADLGDELMALDAEGGICFGFNSVATSVWRHLVSPKSFEDLKEALLAEYDVSGEQCAEELQELLENLLESGLVRILPR
jgi:hypothetical protein